MWPKCRVSKVTASGIYSYRCDCVKYTHQQSIHSPLILMHTDATPFISCMNTQRNGRRLDSNREHQQLQTSESDYTELFTNPVRKLEYKGNGKRGDTDTLKPILYLRSINPEETKGNKLHPHTWVYRYVLLLGRGWGSDNLQRQAA